MSGVDLVEVLPAPRTQTDLVGEYSRQQREAGQLATRIEATMRGLGLRVSGRVGEVEVMEPNRGEGAVTISLNREKAEWLVKQLTRVFGL